MGLLDEYGVGLEDVEAASFDVPDNIYEFEVGDVYIQNGTDNFPDRVWLVIQYLLGDAGKSKTEWFQLPEDAQDQTTEEKQRLGFLKSRLLDLGLTEAEAADPDRDRLIGVVGTLQAFTRTSKKGTFQNIKNVKIDTDGINEFAESDEEEAEEEEAPKPAARAPRTSTPKAPAKAAPGTARAVTQRAASAGVKANPFGKKG